MAVASMAVVLSSCGGSDGESSKTEASQDAAAPAPVTSAAPRITKSRYIARADRVCVAARARLLPLRAKTIAASTGDQAEIDKLNMLFAQTGTLTAGLSAAAAAQDAQKLRELSAQVTTVAGKYRSAAKAYGFHQCGTTAVQALNRRGNR